MEYKWTVLTNTTLGVIMSSMNMYIVLISLPTIFRGLNINPFLPGEFIYLLWILMGYSIVLASVLVTFGRISDKYGRARVYTYGFVIFTVASILLSVIPSNTGNLGAILLIIFRMVQALGGGFLMVNSSALLTDAFPINERGKALGLNQVSMVIGSFLGLILGGLLAGYDWHLIFVVNVPFALAGMLWSIFKLKKTKGAENISFDIIGNVTLAAALIIISLGLTYALMPYGSSQLGWGNPWVLASFPVGFIFLILFVYYERKARDPLFKLSLFKVRPFSYGVLALFLNALARGAIMFLVAIWLQGIYLPLHGISYTQTPFWAGVYMLSMMIGTVIMGPIGGMLTDKFGARIFATIGMIIVALSLYALTLLPYNFNLIEFEIILFINGLGNGLFSAPNTTAILNSLPSRDRGTGNGMRQTFNNIGSTISMALFFTITISFFVADLPSEIVTIGTEYGLPISLISFLKNIPASGLLFAAFLGIDPSSALPKSIAQILPKSVLSLIDSESFLPSLLGPAFINALRLSLYISVALVLIGSIFSYMRGGRYVYEDDLKANENKKRL
ncbi:MAG: MFS transporter [Nitrososphaeria archaeon]